MTTKTICHSECPRGRCLFVDDPIFTHKVAAAYLGRSARTLNKLHLDRVPMPGEGVEWGYRRSTLNQYLAQLESAQSRLHPSTIRFVEQDNILEALA